MVVLWPGVLSRRLQPCAFTTADAFDLSRRAFADRVVSSGDAQCLS
jgi:hypothetical protein